MKFPSSSISYLRRVFTLTCGGVPHILAERKFQVCARDLEKSSYVITFNIQGEVKRKEVIQYLDCLVVHHIVKNAVASIVSEVIVPQV
jgi:hypothetical protein